MTSYWKRAEDAWYVPQDVYGLIRLMGGDDQFGKKLDSLYNGPEKPYIKMRTGKRL